MKIRSAPLDDIYDELDFVLRDDGGLVALALLYFFRCVYGLHRRLMLAILRLNWRDGSRRTADVGAFPAIGEEPFNLSPAELEENW